MCATLIACAAAAQKPNELECLLSCLRSLLFVPRLPARLSPRVRFETRIKQTALMLDPCRSESLALLPPLFFPPRLTHRRRGSTPRCHAIASYQGDARNRLSDAITPRGANPTRRNVRNPVTYSDLQMREIVCASNREHCERISPLLYRGESSAPRLRDNGEIKRRFLALARETISATSV